jgi:hypothetical protein
MFKKVYRHFKKDNGNYRHGMKGTRFYNIWCGIKIRIFTHSHTSYKWYGGRNIKICDRWLKFENFRDDMYESYLEHCKKYGKKDTSIDRINTFGNYYKENCRWATQKEQTNNTRKKYEHNNRNRLLASRKSAENDRIGE